MVGEIRDGETAELAIHAGLTGHYVLSTLHTNDALGAVPRLLDMNVEPFLLASTLDVVVAQRLVRRLCADCVVPMADPAPFLEVVRRELSTLPPGVLPAAAKREQLYRAAGCAHCSGTGYRGRVAIAEALAMTPEMQQIVMSGNDAKTVAAELKRQKFLTLRQDGMLKALLGVTSVEEVLRATAE
jgi:type II secretory ATPase GspE/PulE/Tfp pilus assembly ATPase PilB-like protein